MKAYLDIHKGKPVASLTKEPDINNPEFWEHVGFSDTWLNDSKYRKALREHEANLMEVENAHISQHPIEGYNEITITKPVFQIVNSGQQAEIEITENGCIVIK